MYKNSKIKKIAKCFGEIYLGLYLKPILYYYILIIIKNVFATKDHDTNGKHLKTHNNHLLRRIQHSKYKVRSYVVLLNVDKRNIVFMTALSTR